MDYTTNIDSS